MSRASDYLDQSEMSLKRAVTKPHMRAVHLDRLPLETFKQQRARIVNGRFDPEQAGQPTARRIFDMLDAVRLPCLDYDQMQFLDDIDTIASYTHSATSLRNGLYLLGMSDTEIDNWFSNAEERCGAVVTSDDYFVDEDNWRGCERCGDKFYLEDELESVRVSAQTNVPYQDWCSECRDRLAFECDISNTWYSDTAFQQARTVSGSTICTWIASDYDYYECPNGHYSDEPDHYNEPDDEPDSDLPDYHDGYRNWYGIIQLANQSSVPYYGLEIEVCFEYNSERSFFIEDSHDYTHYCFERDGSLCEERGMEVITRPYTLAELKADDAYLKKIIGKVKAHGAATDPSTYDDENSYGIHVTTNWGRLTDDHKKRFAQMMLDQKRLAIFVAGREDEDYAPYVPFEGEKHVAVRPRNAPGGINDGNAVEIRIFKSTLNYERILSYVEFVDAMIEWTRNPERITEGPLAASLFRIWVRMSGNYPYLSRRFAKSLTAPEAPCASPLLNPPTRRSNERVSKRASRTTPTAQASPTFQTMQVPAGVLIYCDPYMAYDLAS